MRKKTVHGKQCPGSDICRGKAAASNKHQPYCFSNPLSSKRPQKKRSSRTCNHVQINAFLLITALIATSLIGGGLAWFIMLDIPDVRSASDYRPKVATIILDRKGRQIDMMGSLNRIKIPLEKMPPLLPKAFVAAEDSRFYHHSGLDMWSIARAAINNLRTGRRSQGGSTITQQVTRSLMLSREKTFFRKFTESILAYRLDTMLSKDEILYIYLNEIYLGQGAYGVEAAARTYFEKKTAQLNLSEIAVLAGLPQSPSRYSPLKNPEAAKARQRYVLNRMAEDGLINAETARHAYAERISYADTVSAQSSNGYFSQYIREILATKYSSRQLYEEGLTVMTTLDSGLQQAAARALRNGVRQVRKRHSGAPSPQGGLVAIEPRTGRIRAMVGGTDFKQSQYNRCLRANRQPGSVFKPLVFAAAFEQGMRPGDRINDARFTIRNSNGTTWSPKNYDNRYLGPTTLSDGLIHSRNIVAVKLLQKVGVKPVIQMAHRAGISSELLPELTLALGASPVSLLEMTAAYTMFAGKGAYMAPVGITSIRTNSGRHIPWPQPRPLQILQPDTAKTMNIILEGVITRGTGVQAKGIRNASGKTGTSDRNTDAWFIGYTPHMLAGVWLGHDRNATLGNRETGGKAAAPVWKEFMQHAGQ